MPFILVKENLMLATFSVRMRDCIELKWIWNRKTAKSESLQTWFKQSPFSLPFKEDIQKV